MVCHFAQATEAEVVGVGVETADEADVLGDVGVGFLQGYLFGRPSTELRPG